MADKTVKHNPAWFGNQWYGSAFDDVDRLRQKDPIGLTLGYQNPIDWHEMDMEKTPNPTQQWQPQPMVNPTSIGWNRVASADPVQVMAQALRGNNGGS
jgi:hypothetical protein